MGCEGGQRTVPILSEREEEVRSEYRRGEEGEERTRVGERRYRTRKGSRSIRRVRKVLAHYPPRSLQARIGTIHQFVSVSERCESESSSPRTTPLSSPGKAASFSPTCTSPLSILPLTANPEAVADCPLNTFETGILNGASSDLEGTSRASTRHSSADQLLRVD